MTTVSGVLIDAGGTFWPEAWPVLDSDEGDRIGLIMAALPTLRHETALQLVRTLVERSAQLGGSMIQGTDSLVRECLRDLEFDPTEWEIAAVRRAMCRPAADRIELFPRAIELFATFRALELPCAVVSNSVWRDGQACQRDLNELGVGRYVDAVVTSVDAGFRKPHPAPFERALAAINCPPERAIMIGDSERNDIEPALALGMRAIRVAVGTPRPDSSAAHAIAGSLYEVAAIARSWAWTDVT